MPEIILRQAHKNYGGGSPDAVKGLDLHIGDGEFMCLLGPSGCGKTTTLRMIAGLENLSGGEIQVAEEIVDCVAKGIFIGPEKRKMGLVFQSYALWPHLTIERNTDFGLRLRKLPRAEREQRVTEVMQALGIEQYRDRYPSQLSGGQQQRVALARMLAVNPGILLLDEPLSNLDARLRLDMRAELKRIHANFGTTILFVTHDQWEAMTLATTIAVMNEGRLQQIGTPDDIYGRPANRFVAEFVGSPPINLFDLADGHGNPVERQITNYLAACLDVTPVPGSVGLRPEALQVAPDEASIPAENFRHAAIVTGILPTGGSWIIETECGDQTVFLTTTESPILSGGDRIFLHAAPTAFHLFDAQGERLAKADAQLAAMAANAT
ncbi:ABC transporter ATP-binding protein [Marivita sp.]|uniref:ABC transporter ATP-binding protein n=1 Tax=Marivita sp. TaxID=2003365 RepID=UPI003F70F520